MISACTKIGTPGKDSDDPGPSCTRFLVLEFLCGIDHFVYIRISISLVKLGAPRETDAKMLLAEPLGNSFGERRGAGIQRPHHGGLSRQWLLAMGIFITKVHYSDVESQPHNTTRQGLHQASMPFTCKSPHGWHFHEEATPNEHALTSTLRPSLVDHRAYTRWRHALS